MNEIIPRLQTWPMLPWI